MKAAVASRLTAAFFGGNSTQLGAVGGGESQTLAANQTPSLTSSNPSQSISVTATPLVLTSDDGILLDFNPANAAGFRTPDNTASFGHAASIGVNSITVNYTNSSQVGVKTVQPTIVCNYIMRII